MRPVKLSVLLIALACPAFAQTPLAVQTETLAAQKSVAGGLGSPAERGLSDNLWQDITFKTWSGLITSQPARQSSPVLRRVLTDAIAARTALPEEGPTDKSTDIAYIRAKALDGYANANMVGLFITAQAEKDRSAALLDLRKSVKTTSSEAERQLQADLARETGKAPDLREQKFLELQNSDPAAAEWLATHGYIDSAALNAAYNTISFTSEEMANPAAHAKKLHGAMLRAYLWQVIQPVSATDTRARLLNNFIESGGAASVHGTRGALLLPALQQLPSNSRYAWAATSMFALAAAQDQREAADGWYDTVASLQDTLGEAQTWQTRLWPIAMAMGLDAVDPAGLSQWFEDAQSLPAANSLPVFGILTLLEARGLIVPPEIWEKVSDSAVGSSAASINPQQLELLKAAAAGGRQGEVILRAGILANTDLSQAPVPVTAAIIRAFAKLGLNELADRLTTEALLTLLFPAHG